MINDNKDLLSELVDNPQVHPIRIDESKDCNSDAEQEAIAKDEYRKRAVERDNEWLDIFYKSFKYLFVWMCFLFACMVSVLVAHWILPKSCLWLDDARLNDIKNIVFTVFASSVVGGLMNKIK